MPTPKSTPASVPEFVPPHLLVKTDIRMGKPDAFEGLGSVLPELKRVGIAGTEVAIAVTGEPEADRREVERLLAWAPRWHDAGLFVYVHPYTQGSANPARCDRPDGGAPHAAFKRVADAAAELAARTGDGLVLTYHAAEYTREPSDSAHSEPELRAALLGRSARFFDLGFRYCEQLGSNIQLVSETQLPPKQGSPRMRIGDRPGEVLETLAGRATGVCWDTGHYMLSVERLGASADPEPRFIRAVTHMHIHDVVDSVDHRPLTPASARVAQYVHLAVSAGSVGSITLEYDYRLDDTAPGATERDRVLAHLEKAVELVRLWAADPLSRAPARAAAPPP